MQRYDDFIWQWCQIKHVMRNGAKWCEMMLFDCIISQLIVKGLSKNHLISLVLMNSFLKSPRPSLPLKRAPPLSPSPFPLRGQGMCQPPYSVLKPLRYKVGGPSEVYASSRAAFFCAGINPPSLKDLLRASAPSGVLVAWASCILNLFPLQGDRLSSVITQGATLG